MLMSAHTMVNLAWHWNKFIVYDICQPHNVNSIIDAITLGPLPRRPLVLGHHDVKVDVDLRVAVLDHG